MVGLDVRGVALSPSAGRGKHKPLDFAEAPSHTFTRLKRAKR